MVQWLQRQICTQWTWVQLPLVPIWVTGGGRKGIWPMCQQKSYLPCQAHLSPLTTKLMMLNSDVIQVKLGEPSPEMHNWRAPWKNRICSTTTKLKLRKSLVKPVMRQKTCNYIELFGSSVRDRMHNAFNVILWTPADRAWRSRVTGFTSDFRPLKTSADICVVHDDLWWKNWTTRYNTFWRAGCSRLE